jgi:phytoene dehydrogenase-like protein
MKTIIIGSGMSGLTAAATLTQRGNSVTLLEQNPQPGGVTQGYQQDSFTWDLGQLLIMGLGPDEPVGRILKTLGVLDRIQVVKDDRGYVFPDFELRKPAEYGGIRWRMEALKRLFPADAPGLDRYWKDYLRFTRLMTFGDRIETSTGLAAQIAKARLYLTLMPFLSRKDWSAQRLMESYFQSLQLQSVFISILADFFTPPSQFLGLGVFTLNPESSFERRMPKTLAPNTIQTDHYSILGGIRTLVDALVARIQELGGKVITNCVVERILVENGRVVGVATSDGQRLDADAVLASGGVKETFFELVGEEHLTPDLARTARETPLMDSVFMVHLGVDFDPRPYVHGVCTYYYGTYDIENGIAEAHQGIYHRGEKGFVVHVPTLHTPGMAPDGMHAMTIYTISPDTLKDGNWEENRLDYANQLIAFAERHIPNLSQHIQTQAIFTPPDFRRIAHTAHHAFGGVAPIQGKPRVAHRTPIQNLYFIGAQSESGGGVNSVIPAAYKVARSLADISQTR